MEAPPPPPRTPPRTIVAPKVKIPKRIGQLRHEDMHSGSSARTRRRAPTEGFWTEEDGHKQFYFKPPPGRYRGVAYPWDTRAAITDGRIWTPSKVDKQILGRHPHDWHISPVVTHNPQTDPQVYGNYDIDPKWTRRGRAMNAYMAMARRVGPDVAHMIAPHPGRNIVQGRSDPDKKTKLSRPREPRVMSITPSEAGKKRGPAPKLPPTRTPGLGRHLYPPGGDLGGPRKKPRKS